MGRPTGRIRKSPVLVTAATERELSLLVRSIDARELPKVGPFRVHEGMAGGTRMLLSVSGVGKVNAAAAVALLLDRFHPSLLVNCGCGGAYAASGLELGHLAIASSESYGDEGVETPDGWQDLDAMGIPLVSREGSRCFNEIPLSLTAAERAVRLAEALGVPCRRGKFVTVSTCSGTAARGRELGNRFNAICESMEGAAVAHMALLWGVTCLEVRGISNRVEDRDLSTWDLQGAVEAAQRFVLKYIETEEEAETP
jgi:futalosine hydrolase